jgi:hypothetical protein
LAALSAHRLARVPLPVLHLVQLAFRVLLSRAIDTFLYLSALCQFDAFGFLSLFKSILVCLDIQSTLFDLFILFAHASHAL